jgi:iron complex outermembrane recepter protein
MTRSKTLTPYARGLAAGVPFLLTALAAAAAGSADKPAEPKDTGTVLLAQANTTASPTTSAAATTAAPADKAQTQVVEVTASKRRERLIDAPTAITAISNERLENLGVESFAGYASLVPNLGVALGSAPGTGAIVLRGLYTGPQQTTSTTAIYLGEAPFTSSGAFALGSFIVPDVDLFDVARVEVLKGPQGTLYGSTALGGLIRIVPRLPDTSVFGGNVKLGASKVSGGGDGYTGKVSLNVPISPGLLAVQVGAFSR